MESPEINVLRHEVMTTAQALIQRTLPFLSGVRKMAALRFQLKGEADDPDFSFFSGVASEADHIPNESARSLCSPSWLDHCNTEAKELEAHYAESVFEACKRIIERYAHVA